MKKGDVRTAEHMFNTHPLTSNKSHLLLAVLHVYLACTLEVVAVANAAVKVTSHIYLHGVARGTMQKQQLNDAHVPVLGSVVKR